MNTIYIPIGQHCHPAHVLQHLNKRIHAFPFDWLSIGSKQPLKSVMDNLSNKFQYFMKDLRKNKDNRVFAKKYPNTIFLHHGKIIKDKSIIMKFQKRINNLLHILKHSKDKVILFHGITIENVTESYIKLIHYFETFLLKIYPKTNIKIWLYVIYNEKDDVKKEKIMKEKFKLTKVVRYVVEKKKYGIWGDSKKYVFLFSKYLEKVYIKDKLHLITYGDKKWVNAKQRIYNEALSTNWFYSIKCYGEEDLSSSFRNEFKTILSMKRGGGYWIWKFDIILNKLEEINNGEFLIYVDSGCTVNINGYNRLKEYIKMIKNNKNKIISFQTDRLEHFWTTKQIFNLFGIPKNNPIRTSAHYIATIMIMQKCEAVINIFKDCLNKIRKDPLIITDHYNRNQIKGFKENKHDQSILSVARKIHGSIVIPDETYSLDFNSKSMQRIPFLATRKR